MLDVFCKGDSNGFSKVKWDELVSVFICVKILVDEYIEIDYFVIWFLLFCNWLDVYVDVLIWIVEILI